MMEKYKIGRRFQTKQYFDKIFFKGVLSSPNLSRTTLRLPKRLKNLSL